MERHLLLEKVARGAGLLLVIAFFLSVFFFYLTPIGVGDFWWHLNTGRWIVENNALPGHDPFTYTVPQDHDLRRMLILRGYWLAQAVLYLAHTAFGFAGPIVLKALIFTLIYFVLWRSLTMRGLDGYAALLVVAFLPFVAVVFDEPRPQIFSFLGVVLIFNILERTLARLRRGEGPNIALWLMPVFMMLWANIHRGYILGFMLIAVYMLDETVQRRRGHDALAAKDYRRFMTIAAVSLASCLINPNFTMAFAGNFVDLGSPFMKSIDELSPLRDFASSKHVPLFTYGTLALFILSALVIFISRRRLRWHHLFLFSGFAFAGVMSGRFSIFMLLMSLSIAARYVPERATRLLTRLRPLWAALLAASVIVLLNSGGSRGLAAVSMVDPYFTPDAAADFISSARPPAPLMNAFEYGGYLGWRLFPDYKMFVDQRNLNYPTFAEYVRAKTGRPSEIDQVLDGYGINTIVFYLINPQDPYIPKIVFHALRQDSWQLLYFDRKGAVFVRADANPAIPVIDKQELWDHLLERATRWRDVNQQKPVPLVMLGSVYEAQGDIQEALRLYREALRLGPDNEDIQKTVEELTEGAGEE